MVDLEWAKRSTKLGLAFFPGLAASYPPRSRTGVGEASRGRLGLALAVGFGLPRQLPAGATAGWDGQQTFRLTMNLGRDSVTGHVRNSDPS